MAGSSDEVFIELEAAKASSSAYDIVLRSLKRVTWSLTENLRQPTLRRLAKFTQDGRLS
jgi:hypothetical protein